MTAPTDKELFNEELGYPVTESSTPCRHGHHQTEVYHRATDGTYWEANYRVENEGDNNGLRDGDNTIRQVFPLKVVSTSYVSKLPEKQTVRVSGKCSDMCSVRLGDRITNGSVPYDAGIGGGDYLEMLIDLETGLIEGWNPEALFEKS